MSTTSSVSCVKTVQPVLEHTAAIFLRPLPPRLLHARIVLYKPSLARYCSISHQARGVTSAGLEPTPKPAKSLKDRVLRECALVCVENAQEMIQLVHREHMPGTNIGVLTWWNRVFYLHVAGTVLIAAMLQPDLYTPSVSEVSPFSRLLFALKFLSSHKTASKTLDNENIADEEI